MGRQLFYALCFVAAFLSQQLLAKEEKEIAPQIPVVDVEGGPSSLALGMVSVIGGNFCDQETDLVLGGPHPLIISRVYSSNAAPTTPTQEFAQTTPFRLAHGWEFNHQPWLYAHRKMLMTEPSGAMLPYSAHDAATRSWSMKNGRDLKGLTNCGSGEISGRTNLKNTRLYKRDVKKRENGRTFNTEEITAHLGDGTVRTYDRSRWHKVCKTKYNNFVLLSDKRPDGVVTEYMYDDWARMTIITQKNPFGKRLNELCFSIPSATKFGISKRDGTRGVTYEMAQHDISEDHLQCQALCLKSVTRPHKPKVVYQWSSGKTRPRMTQKSYPNNRFVSISYNPSSPIGKHVFDADRVNSIQAPVGTDSKAITIGTFEYERGQTRFYDAYKNLTSYYHTDDRVTDIVRYQDKQRLSSEHFSWGAGGNETNLMSHVIKAKKGGVAKALYYKYDGRGNILEKTLRGVLRQKGVTEDYVTHYEYSNDGKNLLLKESYPCGKEVLYSYLKGTDLLVSKLVGDEYRLLQRTFYAYDQNRVLSQKIVDNGSGKSVDDLTDVTQRTRMTIVANDRGLPQDIMEDYLEEGTYHPLHHIRKTYDACDRVILEETFDANDIFSFSKKYTYNAFGQVIHETDALGHEVSREYDANGNLTREEGPRPGFVKTFTYDFSNRLTSEEEHQPDGQVFTKSCGYDYLSNKVSVTDYSGNTTRYVYDALGRCIETRYPNGDVEKREYDVLGNVTRFITPDGEETRAEYSLGGEPLEVNYPDGTTVSLQYSIDGDLAAKTNKDGSTVLYINDALGRVIQEDWLFDDGSLAKTISYRYDGFNLLEKTDGEGYVTTYTYDGAGRLKARCCGQECVQYQYDALGRQSVEIRGAGDEATRLVKEFDLLDRVISERTEDAAGNLQTRVDYEYDEVGNRTIVTHFRADGEQVTQMEYDALGQPIRVTDSLGQTTTTDYNYQYANGQGQTVLQVTVTDPLGQKSCLTHDVRGREVIKEVFDPAGGLIAKNERTYNAAGLVVRSDQHVITPGKIEVPVVITLWQYGPLGRVEAITQAAGTPKEKVTAFRYNDCGQKVATLRPDGVVVSYLYDGLGRLLHHGASDDSFHYSYQYDLRDLPIEIIDENRQQTTYRTYDANGHVQAETLQTGLGFSFDFDSQGRRKALILPDGSAVHYKYSGPFLKEVARLNTEGVTNPVHTYDGYGLDGTLLSSTGLGGVTNFTYDALGRKKEVVHPCFHESLEYDEVGNVTHITTQDPKGSFESYYAYDALYQLIGEGGVEEHLYTYDSLYNRRQEDARDHTLNELFEVLSDGDSDYVYDCNGNRIAKGNITYRYDALDRLVAVVTPDDTIEYTYDAFNRRLTKESQEGITCYLYDDQDEIGAIVNGVLKEFRVLGQGLGAEIGAAVAIELDGEAYQPIHNARGDVVALVDESQIAISCSRYTAFGKEQVLQDSPNPWRFQSKRVDAESGFVFFGRRAYDPALGRWISPDPLGFDAGPNLYAYVSNRPLISKDLYGLYGRYHCPRCGNNRHYPRQYAPSYMSDYSPHRGPRRYGDGYSYFGPDVKKVDDFEGVYIVGKGELTDDRRLVYKNGINTSLRSAIRQARRLSRLHGNCNVHLLYEPSSNIAFDAADAVAVGMGKGSRSARTQAEYWDHLLTEMAPDGKIVQYAWSKGAIVTRQALSYAKDLTKERLHVSTFGGGAMITRTDLKDSMNYVSRRDIVPQLQGVASGFFSQGERQTGVLDPDANIKFLGTPSGIPWVDHSFESKRYQGQWGDLGREFIKTYGRIEG